MSGLNLKKIFVVEITIQFSIPRNRGNRDWIRERNRHADGHYGADARATTVVEIVDILEDSGDKDFIVDE